MATLTYTGGTVDSNIVTGELREVLTVVKTAVNKSYELGGRVTYVISLSNSGTVALTGLTLTDDLGGYAFGGTTLYPLPERCIAGYAGCGGRTAHDGYRRHRACWRQCAGGL